jgi:hypothetical protein
VGEADRGGQVFEPYADHLQFVLEDAEAESGIGDTWAEAPEAWRISPERHVVAVGTARYDYVPVVLELLNSPPPDSSFEDADHVVEADLDLPSGKLAIHGGTQLPGEVEPLYLEPGRYRLRVSYVQTDYQPSGSNEDLPGDHLEYQITMWPIEVPSEVRVLKQVTTPGRTNRVPRSAIRTRALLRRRT